MNLKGRVARLEKAAPPGRRYTGVLVYHGDETASLNGERLPIDEARLRLQATGRAGWIEIPDNGREVRA